jgi:tRNA(Ile)-lysidine synthase
VIAEGLQGADGKVFAAPHPTGLRPATFSREGRRDALDVAAVLDHRLDPGLTQPIAVAFSGGGDSLGALIATKAWADGCGRPVIALHVDHGLQAASGDWRAFAATAADRLGVSFHVLAWTGEKPVRGLAAAARQARHGLIAEAARAARASTVVFGHTADDIAEGVLMRAAGSSLGSPREWAPSPVWPEGRGVFLLRPLLGVRRAAIREALQARGWDWIDDPANADLRQPRARARRELNGAMGASTPDDCDTLSPAGLAAVVDWGAIRFDRDALRQAPPAAGRRVLGAAMLSAGGGERPPRADRVEALLARLIGADDFAATLAGAKLVAARREALVVRDAGEIARGGLSRMALEPGRATVWDGRFEFRAGGPGLAVGPLKGSQSRLDKDAQRRLKDGPAEARPALPVIIDETGALTCPILAGPPGIGAHCLVGARFSAACGAILREPRA